MHSSTDDAHAHYETDGYIVVRGCVDGVMIDGFVENVDAVLVAQLEQSAGSPFPAQPGIDGIYERLKALYQHDQEIYVATLRVFNKFKSLYDLFLSPGVRDTCRDLGVVLPMMHTLPLFHILSHALKIDGGYRGFVAHQDWHGIQTSVNAIIVWLPFHDIARDRLPIEVSPAARRAYTKAPRWSGGHLRAHRSAEGRRRLHVALRRRIITQ